MLFWLSQGVSKALWPGPRGFKTPCPRGLVADGKGSHRGSSLVNTSQGG